MKRDLRESSSRPLSSENRLSSPQNELEAKITDDHLRFHFRHLVTVALITGIVQGFIFCICVTCYATRIQHECRTVTAQEAERIIQGKFADWKTLASDFVGNCVKISRMRRQANDRIPRNGATSRPTRRPNHHHQRSSKTRRSPSTYSALGIHLEFSVPNLDRSEIVRLNNDSDRSETVDFGHIFSKRRFKPYADRSGGTTRYSFRNWVPAKWFNSTSNIAMYRYNHSTGAVHVQSAGLFYIYSQIRLYHNRPCSYAVMVNDDHILFKCIDGTDGGANLWQFSNCHMGGITVLKAGDRLWLRDMYGAVSHLYDYYVHLDPALGASSYWGVVQLNQGT